MPVVQSTWQQGGEERGHEGLQLRQHPPKGPPGWRGTPPLTPLAPWWLHPPCLLLLLLLRLRLFQAQEALNRLPDGSHSRKVQDEGPAGDEQESPWWTVLHTCRVTRGCIFYIHIVLAVHTMPETLEHTPMTDPHTDACKPGCGELGVPRPTVLRTCRTPGH